MKCLVKHAKYNPPDEKWKCQKCGSSGDLFAEKPENATEDCELLHDADACYCLNCNTEWSGKELSAEMALVNQMIPCPYCKGAGMIKDDKTEKEQAAEPVGRKSENSIYCPKCGLAINCKCGDRPAGWS